MSDEIAERKSEGSSGGSERVASGSRMYMVEGLLALGADSVEVLVTVATACASSLRLGVRFSWAAGEKFLLIGVAVGPG